MLIQKVIHHAHFKSRHDRDQYTTSSKPTQQHHNHHSTTNHHLNGPDNRSAFIVGVHGIVFGIAQCVISIHPGNHPVEIILVEIILALPCVGSAFILALCALLLFKTDRCRALDASIEQLPSVGGVCFWRCVGPQLGRHCASKTQHQQKEQ